MLETGESLGEKSWSYACKDMSTGNSCVIVVVDWNIPEFYGKFECNLWRWNGMDESVFGNNSWN